MSIEMQEVGTVPRELRGRAQMNLAFALAQAARRDGGAPAITSLSGESLAYCELEERVRRLGSGLLALGLETGDRVVLAMSNAREYVEILYGAWAAGLCVAPLNSRLHAREISHAAADCGAKIIFATRDVSARLTEVELPAPVVAIEGDKFGQLLSSSPGLIKDIPATAPAWLFYTSGTTGRPKGAILTHRNLNAMIVSFLADSDAGGSDTFVHMTPQSHAGGLFSLAYVARGLNQIVLPAGGLTREYARTAFGIAGRGSCFAVPTLVKRFVEQDYFNERHCNVHKILFGGAPMYAADLRTAISYFGATKLWGLYGQGEAPCTITHLPPSLTMCEEAPHYAEACASVGIPRTGVAVRVVRDDGSEANGGEVGEVTVKGDVVMAGYWNEPSATAETIRDGWLHTGDLGCFGDSGLLTLVDRSKDVIISGGSNIYPREVEEILLLHPLVREAAVVGVPDREWGERPVAFIVARDEISEESIVKLCRQHLAAYKAPSAIRFVNKLPESAYGKVLKSELRRNSE